MSAISVPISVIIPFYRDSSTISRAVSSIVDQTWRPAEIIIVDDASHEDASKVVLEALQRKYPEIVRIVWSERNGGPSIARNMGWGLARYPTLAFLDADDAWHHKKVETQFPLMRVGNGIALSGHLVKVGVLADLSLPSPGDAPNTKMVSFKNLLYRNYFSTSSVMISRDIALRFSPGRRFAEDYELWLAIIYRYGPSPVILEHLTIYFKDTFGAGGLSGRLWQMEKSQLEIYHDLLIGGRITSLNYFTLLFWSEIRFIRRVMLTMLRRLRLSHRKSAA